jgi:hypothetical protein
MSNCVGVPCVCVRGERVDRAQGFKRYLDDVDHASRDCAAAVRRLVCSFVMPVFVARS